DFDKQKPEAAKQMQTAMQNGDTCISCHKGIAHKMPDMSAGYKAMLNDIKADAGSDTGDEVYAIATMPLYADQPSDDAGKGDGNLMPLAKVKVLERSGDWAKVSIDGWAQDGVERLLVTAMGRRIFEATLSPDMAQSLQVLQTTVDPDTDLTWHEASIEAWTKADNLTDDAAGLNDYGTELKSAACGACHATPPSDHYLANQWIGIVKEMKGYTALSAEEVRILQSFIQLHAKDMEAGS
ncbi:NapC/NirT family cytochrome c, partial [Consotaella aegiceratis]|uniref:NapC/NirT family cytochrome c n=1 Tax=Consotaella aegiceratis TaxID=3097961 RepID=UPI002F3F144B